MVSEGMSRLASFFLCLLLAPHAVATDDRRDGSSSASKTAPATCRDSRLPPKSSWSRDESGEEHLRLKVDVDADGLEDVLDVTSGSGSGFEGTSVQLTLGGSGTRLEAEEGFNFAEIVNFSPVPKELLDPHNRAALAWIEEALFDRICEAPDPSLAWLLDPTKRLTWTDGPPKMPGFYAIRLPVSRLAGSLREAAFAGPGDVERVVDPGGEVWLAYAGHTHSYPGRDGRARPVGLAREGDRVLLGTAHGVILTDLKRSRHAWIYVFEGGGDKLRNASIAGAHFDGDTAVIRLERSSDSNPSLVHINLTTGAVSKEQRDTCR